MAGPVSGYLPLNLEPEVERQIERVLILADEPILKRPFPIELVQAALPRACELDRSLCNRVKRYLDRYSRDFALTHASIEGTVKHGGTQDTVANAHGLPMDSVWNASVQAYVQPSDYLLASAGLVAYDGRVTPTGSALSLGFNFAQIDLGYRDRWWSPATDSSMLLSTNAPTMPSVTISNWEPMTFLGFQYEVFWARMAHTDHILTGGQSTFSIERGGDPKLFGAQLSIEPFPGWSFGVNRTTQYGAGGLPGSPHFLIKDFFSPSGNQDVSNHQASYISRFIVPSKNPFAVYFQYAGENTVNGGSYLLGESSLTAGIDIPRILHHFDMTYEFSEWQNRWYTNSPFLDGMTNDGLVTGNWGADQRQFGDGVGGRSQSLRVGWLPPFGGYLEERVRLLTNQNYHDFIQGAVNYGGVPPAYHHYYDVMLRYSRPWSALTVGGEAEAGRDVYGQSFARLSGFVRYGGDANTRDDGSPDEETEHDDAPAGTQIFVDAGMNLNKLTIDVQKGIPVLTTQLAYGAHLGLGARRAVSAHNDLGVRIEADSNVNGYTLIGARAVDWRYRFGAHFAVGAFGGVARYDLATPAYSIYFGSGVQWRDVLPKFDLGLDIRYAQNVARNHVLASDPDGVRPDSFYRIKSATLYISRRF